MHTETTFRPKSKATFKVGLPLLLVVIFLPLGAARGQATTPRFYLGAYVGLGVVSYSGPVSPTLFTAKTTFPGDAAFQTGDGFGLAGGLLMDFTISDLLSIGLRVGY